MKKTILFLVVLAFYNTIYAQNKNMSNNSSANSYEQELLLFENGRYSDIHRDTIIKYGRVLRDSAKLYEEVDVAKSITYELKYLSMQRKYGIDPDTLTTFTNLGKYYKENEDYANAQLYFNKALTLAESLFPASEQRHVELYIQLASLYGRIQEPENAFAYSEKARVIESKINGSETETYATIVMNSALYKFMSGDVTYCLNQLKQVYQHPKCKKINVAINLAGVYSDQGDADSCYKYVAEAWDMIREEVVFNIENLTIEDRFKYFTTEKTYSLITSPINYFLQHEGHKGLLRLAYNCILFYKKTGMAITNNNNNEIEKAISFDTIKGLLKENEIAIELWSDISGSWYSDYILAFVVSPNEKDPVFVKLPKDSIYMALNNELEASKTFLPLYETMWKNLINSIVLKKHGKIYISCDDIYTLIPFESICNYDFEYLGDVYSIIRVSYTGNIKNVKSEIKIRDIALYGGLQYDCFSEKGSVDKLALSSNDVYLAHDTISTDYRGTMRYLPWTQVEIDSIYAVLQFFKELEKIQAFNGNEGTEETFRTFSGDSPSIIHLATHGRFSQPTEEMNWYDYYRYCMENAGVFLSCYSDSSIDGNGFLSAKKIRSLDLSKTKMVVLSACNTGLGGVTPYGIIGLQYAFKQAGVGSIIMTLNRVDDAATQYFMTSFYKAIALGMDPHDAYKSAQYEIRTNEYFKKFNYWAYFIMID